MIVPVEGVPVFPTLYHAASWWSRASQTAYYAQAARGQAGDFERQQVGAMEPPR